MLTLLIDSSCSKCSSAGLRIRNVLDGRIKLGSLNEGRMRDALGVDNPNWKHVPTLLIERNGSVKLKTGVWMIPSLIGALGWRDSLRLVRVLGERTPKEINDMNGTNGKSRRDFIRSVGLGALFVGGALMTPNRAQAKSEAFDSPLLNNSALHQKVGDTLSKSSVQFALRDISVDYDIDSLDPLAFSSDGESLVMLGFPSKNNPKHESAVIIYTEFYGEEPMTKVEYLTLPAVSARSRRIHPLEGLQTRGKYYEGQMLSQDRAARGFIACMSGCVGITCLPTVSRCTLGGPWVIAACMAGFCGRAAWNCFRGPCRGAR